LLHQIKSGDVRVMLAHPGGPYFAKKDGGAWTIPKGVVNSGEAHEAAARREFAEEVGWQPIGALLPIGETALPSGKRVIGSRYDRKRAKQRSWHGSHPGRLRCPGRPGLDNLQNFRRLTAWSSFPSRKRRRASSLLKRHSSRGCSI
jgi:predicted NUDIX family NTP pyrophosphohydrolase